MYIPAELYADVKSDTDRLYTAGDKVTHMETAPGQFSVLDRDEKVRFHGLVAVRVQGCYHHSKPSIMNHSCPEPMQLPPDSVLQN